jgi:hypothetical protein
VSTRAVYTFIDEYQRFSVYKHYDGYPEGEGGGSGAFGFIKAAKQFAWELPRFDASEFAAAFIKANKSDAGGDVYLTQNPDNHSDLSYKYEITKDGNKLVVKTFEATGWNQEDNQNFIEKRVDTL